MSSHAHTEVQKYIITDIDKTDLQWIRSIIKRIIKIQKLEGVKQDKITAIDTPYEVK